MWYPQTRPTVSFRPRKLPNHTPLPCCLTHVHILWWPVLSLCTPASPQWPIWPSGPPQSASLEKQSWFHHCNIFFFIKFEHSCLSFFCQHSQKSVVWMPLLLIKQFECNPMYWWKSQKSLPIYCMHWFYSSIKTWYVDNPVFLPTACTDFPCKLVLLLRYNVYCGCLSDNEFKSFAANFRTNLFSKCLIFLNLRDMISCIA